MENITLRVDGMSCNHCVMSVEKALKELPGVSGVKVDLAGKTVNVLFEGALVSYEKIKEAIDDAGYEVVE